MSLSDMQAELRGVVPKLPFSFTKVIVNRAYRTTRERSLWSFSLFEGQWIAPAQFSGVSCSVVQGSQTVTLSSADSTTLAALLLTQPYSLIIQRQFRVMPGGVYFIRAYDPNGGGSGIATLTLDRWYGEATSSTAPFLIYQCYFAPTVANSPILDFKSWISVRDMVNFRDLFTERYQRRELDAIDPQRTWFGIPSDVVPFENDQYTSSPSFGALLYELWAAPLFTVNYQLYGIRSGLDLVKPTDTVPLALGEDIIMALARYYAYEWAEANKDIAPRNVGPDFKYLMGGALKEYNVLLAKYRLQDRERVDNWFALRRPTWGGGAWPHYNTLAGGWANPGGSVW